MIKVTPESIHAVVLGLSSAIITEKDIREEFVYRTVSASPEFFVAVIFALCCGYVYMYL